MKFKKDDICICSYYLRKNIKKGESITKNNCRVRITSKSGKNLYNVYNLDFERYEKLGKIYLKFSLEETRNFKLKQLLNDTENN
jgi:hypothetical protein